MATFFLKPLWDKDLNNHVSRAKTKVLKFQAGGLVGGVFGQED
jgi:hypothetical protein